MSASGTLDFDSVFRGTDQIPAGDGYDATNVIHRLSKFTGISSFNKEFGGGTSPTWEDIWAGIIQLGSGTFTLDLQALPLDDPYIDKDLTGKKVVAFAVAAASANTDVVTVAGAGSNPYELFGSVDDQVDVAPGQVYAMGEFVQANLAAVSGTVKDITFTSPDADAIAYIWLAAGT